MENLKDMVNKHTYSTYIMVLIHDYATLKPRHELTWYHVISILMWEKNPKNKW